MNFAIEEIMMKTILQIKGNPVEIAKFCCDGIFNINEIYLDFSRMRITDDSVYVFFSNGSRPHLMALLILKEEFEVRRIDAFQTTMYYKSYALMTETPPEISNYLKRSFKAA